MVRGASSSWSLPVSVKTDLLLPTALFFPLLAIFPACLLVLAWGLGLAQGCSVVRGASSSLSLPVSVRTDLLLSTALFFPLPTIFPACLLVLAFFAFEVKLLGPFLRFPDGLASGGDEDAMMTTSDEARECLLGGLESLSVLERCIVGGEPRCLHISRAEGGFESSSLSSVYRGVILGVLADRVRGRGEGVTSLSDSFPAFRASDTSSSSSSALPSSFATHTNLGSVVLPW